MKLSMTLQFPIKVLQADIGLDEKTRVSLIESIERGEIEGSTEKRSNIGRSWRSSLHLQNEFTCLPLLAVKNLVDTFTGSCVTALYRDHPRFTIEEMWINRLDVGAYNAPHDHLPHHWSGILWLDAENEPDDAFPAGNVEFMSPYPIRAFGSDQSSFFASPINGVAILFPSGIKHMVHPVKTKPRIAMAWNCRIEGQ